MNEIIRETHFRASEIRKKLEREPYCHFDSLLRHVSCSWGDVVQIPVEVKKIIGTMTAKDWYSFCRSDEYFELYVHNVQSGKFDYEKDPPDLVEVDGTYFVSTNGRTRVAVAKFLDLPFISSRVTKIIPNFLFVYSAEEYAKLEERRQMGLWDGKWILNENYESLYQEYLKEAEIAEKECQSGGITDDLVSIPQPVLYGCSRIEYYEGVWAFADSPDLAKDLYRRIGVLEGENDKLFL